MAVAAAVVVVSGISFDRAPTGAMTVEIGSEAEALFLRKAWRSVKRRVRRARRWVRRTVTRARNRVRRTVKNVRRRVSRATSRVRRTVRKARSSVVRRWRSARKKASGAFRKARSSVKRRWRSARKKFSRGFRKARGWMRRTGKKFSGAFRKAGRWIKSTAKKVGSKLRTAYNAVRTFVDPSGYTKACASRSKSRISGPCNGSSKFCNRRYDQVTQAMTHNSMAAMKYMWAPGFANHCQTITTQLNDGIRGLMLDSHQFRGKTWLCHGSCAAGRIGLVKGLTEIRKWLERNRKQVVTINWENGVTGTQMKQAMERSGMMRYVYVHPTPASAWPTLGEMIRTGKRLVLFTSGGENSFAGYHSVGTFTWENQYAAKRVRDLGCKTRGYEQGPVFTLNHFLTDPVGAPHLAKQANKYSAIINHAQACQRSLRLRPTFIAVDWYELGDVLKAVKTLNGV